MVHHVIISSLMSTHPLRRRGRSHGAPWPAPLRPVFLVRVCLGPSERKLGRGLERPARRQHADARLPGHDFLAGPPVDELKPHLRRASAFRLGTNRPSCRWGPSSLFSVGVPPFRTTNQKVRRSVWTSKAQVLPFMNR